MNAVIGIVLGISLVAATPDETERAHAQLAEAGVALETDALLTVLRRRILRPEDRERVSAAIGDLGSDLFQRRAEATLTLIDIGPKSLGTVKAALATTKDAEIVARLNYVAKQVADQRDDRLLWSALVVLRSTHPPEAVALLLDLLPELPSRRLRAPAQEALWASVDDQHLTLLRTHRDEAIQQAAALVALEKLTANPRLALQELDHASPVIRLAAARVLSAHRPGLAAGVLVELRDNSERAIQAESEYLLRLLFLTAEKRDAPKRNSPDQWRAWVKLRGPGLVRLDGRRHRCGVVQIGIREDFSIDAPDAAKGYGAFVYESTVPSKVSVRDGRLYLDGDHDEGDQRLAISAQALASEPVVTTPMVIESLIGGQPGNEIGWHVGISVGKLKALFHPGYPGGAFRVETVDEHINITPNQTMPFTPASGMLHSMRLQVTPQRDGGAQIQVRVKDAQSDQTFESTLTVTKQQLGPLNRVGLERSGRAGGAAMFDELKIELQ